MLLYEENPEKKMIELGVTGKITSSEYDKIFEAVKKRLDEWDEVRVLEVIDGFEGIEAMALWKDLKYAFSDFPKINHKISKCAVVADAKWIELMSMVLGTFLKGELKFFPKEAERDARSWLLH